MAFCFERWIQAGAFDGWGSHVEKLKKVNTEYRYRSFYWNVLQCEIYGF